MWWRNGALGVALVIFAASVLAMGQSSSADDWPGWRGNGDGVNDDGSYPEKWSTTENVLWKTEIPGLGYSSPIVVGDRVFVTTAVESSARKATQWTCLFVLVGLAIVGLSFCSGGVFRYPTQVADPQMFTEPKNITKHILRNVGLALLFFLMLYVSLRAVAFIAAHAAPNIAERLGTGFNYPYASRLFDGFPFSRYAWFLCGGVSAIVIFIINVMIDRWSGVKPPEPSKRGILHRALGIAEGFVVLGSAGAFFGMLLTNTGLLLLGPHSHQATIAEVALMSSVGLIAAAGLSLRTSWWRLVAALLSLGLMAYLLVLLIVPEDAPMHAILNNPRQGLTKLLFYVVTMIAIAWLGLRGIPLRRKGQKTTGQGAMKFGLASVFLLATVAIQYVANIKIVPGTTLLRQVLCLNADTGESVWSATCSEGPRGVMSHRNSAATSTPVSDGECVYAHFGDASTHCLNGDGDVLWSVKEDIVVGHEGVAISPVLYKNLLIVCYETDHLSYTIAYDKKTGEQVWRDDREPPSEEGFRDCYSTPAIVAGPTGDTLIHITARRAFAFEPTTGRRLWNLERPPGQVVGSPILAGKHVILPLAADGVGSRLDGVLVEGNAPAALTPQLVWKNKKRVCGVSSPLYYNGLLYGVSNKGIASCRDEETGEIVWQIRLPNKHYASPVAADGKVYFCSIAGETSVMAAGEEANILATNSIDEHLYTSFALANGRIFIRGTKHLYCIGQKK